MADLRNEYTQHIHDTAPDMDKLWDRIECEIDKKETITDKENETTYTENREKIKSNFSYSKIAAVAAAFIVVFAGANIINESRKARIASERIPTERTSKAETNNGDMADGAAYDDDEKADDADDAYDDRKTENDETEAVAGGTTIINYESLSFNATDTAPYNNSYVAAGNEFFVEKDVLADTQLFADVMVINATFENDKAVYDLQVNDVYTKEGTLSFENITITSSSPYILQKNREYLLPLRKNNNGDYTIVFENAPQIELTLDGGMVFQNGWDSLENGSMTLEKKNLNMNDYYFDRMRYSPSDDLSQLMIEWKKA